MALWFTRSSWYLHMSSVYSLPLVLSISLGSLDQQWHSPRSWLAQYQWHSHPRWFTHMLLALSDQLVHSVPLALSVSLVYSALSWHPLRFWFNSGVLALSYLMAHSCSDGTLIDRGSLIRSGTLLKSGSLSNTGTLVLLGSLTPHGTLCYRRFTL